MFKITKTTKIISAIIFLILFLTGIQFYLKPKVDTNSYVTLIEWKAFLNSKKLKIKEKKVLKAWNIIKTVWENSLAIIKWWDWSITRIWWNTTLKINKADVSPDLTKIQILFNLLWKTWKTRSDVVSFIGEDSYFKEWFVDTEAAVRWTSFEVNLEKKYLYVNSHEVSLKDKKNGKKYIVREKQAINIFNFDFIALEKFILKVSDKAWRQLNEELDKEYFKKIKKNLESFIKNEKKFLDDLNSWNISWLTKAQKEELYKKLLKKYEELKPSTISPKDSNLYKYKLEYQKLLSSIAPKEAKKDLLRTTTYDLKQAIDLKNFSDFKEISSLIIKNKDFVDINEVNKVLDLSSLWEEIKKNFNLLLKSTNINTNDLNKIFWDSFESFKRNFWDTLKWIWDWLKQNLNNFSNDAKWLINDLWKNIIK